MNAALPLPSEQAIQLANRTIFSAKEIQSLYKRFKELDVSGNSILEYEVSPTSPSPRKPRGSEHFSRPLCPPSHPCPRNLETDPVTCAGVPGGRRASSEPLRTEDM